MRLVLLTSSFASSRASGHNAGGFVRDVATGLAADGHDVMVITPQIVDDLDGFGVRRIRRLGAETSLSHIDPGSLGAKIRLASVMVSGTITLAVEVIRHRPDRVVAFWALPAGLMAAVVRLVTRTRFDVWVLGSDVWRVDDYPRGRQLLRWVLRSADGCFADGTDLVEEVEQIAAVPCTFLPSSRTLPAPEPRRHTTSPRRKVMAVGRFHEHKGFDDLIAALAGLPEAIRTGIEVDIWGGGPEEAQLQSLVSDADLNDIVRFRGFIDAQTFANEAAVADVAVIPSRLESVPVVLSDFAQMNTPLIVTDTGDMGALTERFGAGVVVPTEAPVALAAAIERAVQVELPGSSDGRRSLADHLGLSQALRRLSRPVG